MPFTATICPARSAIAAAESAASPAARVPPRRERRCCGPQTAQAIGSAWNRRLPGSSYSARQGAQSANTAIVVRARSYGRSRTMV